MRAWVVCIVCIVASACATAPNGDVARDDGPPPAPAGGAEDLDAVVRRARFAFRMNGGALVGGHDTYTARIEEEGAIAFTPAGAGEPATVRTTTVDGEPRDRRAQLLPDGGVEIVSGSVRERLQNTKDGLEQSWIFGARPGTLRDLVVRVAVGGYVYDGATDGGHHFRERSGHRLLRYGRATWIDREGHRARVDTRMDGAELVLTVPRDLVAQSSFPATLDPVIGPETAVDTAVTTATISAIYPSVAPGPSGTFFVATIDRRDRARDGSLGGSIRATRVSAAGEPLDNGIYVASTTSEGAQVVYDSVASRWTTFFVRPNGGVGFARVDSAGKLLDKTPLPVRDGVYEYTATFDGAKTFVATSYSSKAGTAVKASFIDATGNVGAGIDVAAAGKAVSSACDTAACAVLTEDAGGARLVRVTRAGSVAGTTLVHAAARASAVASSGSEYLVVTRDNVSPTTLYATRVSSAGVVLDTAPITVATAPYDTSLAVSWNGTRFVVAWSSSTNVLARRARMQADGGQAFEDASAVSLLATAANPGFGSGLSGASNGATTYLAASTYEGTTYGSRVDASLTALDAPPSGVLLTNAGNAQWQPAVARSSSGYLVAWSDERATPNAIWSVRLGTTGLPVSAAKLIAVSGDHPSVASDGTDYVVTWRDAATVRAVSVSAATGDPNVAGPTTVTTSTISAQRSPYLNRNAAAGIAHDGQSYVVAWTDYADDQFLRAEVFAARLSSTAAVLDANPIRLGPHVSEQYAPAVASDGKTGSLVVWSDERIESYQTDLFGTRVDRGGTLLDASPIPIATGGFNEGSASLAWDGTHYVVVWHDSRGAAPGPGTYVTRVSASAGSLDTNGVQVSKEIFGSLPSAIVSMQDGTSLVGWGGYDGAWGAFVRTGSGEVLDFGGIPLGSEPGRVGSVALAPAGVGRALLVSTRYLSDAGAPRVVARFVESGKTVSTTCTEAAECASRWCTDGVCCSEKCDGPCMKCDAAGKCVAVTSANDDACVGSCDATGACKKKNGDTCSVANECASGFCADGFCCESACDGGCDVCNEQLGKCTPATKRSRGGPSCSPFVCNGVDRACPVRCEKDDDCADGFGCDRPTGACVSGAVCSDTRTLREPSGTTNDCSPYACRAGACLVTCTGVSDCNYPAVCDERGLCVDAGGEASGGCAIAEREPPSRVWMIAVGLVAAAAVSRASRRRVAR